ncbi:BtrH N-terminal domain-containing protein, partial [Streptomyces solincola]|uniref:BtrH N-terminal domain-containing protein n=1 Tax=Streptomyces solincola TaxID=2100817 RepID=UPI002AFE741E
VPTTTDAPAPAEAAAPPRPAQAPDRPELFYRDPLSCLQSTFAAVLAARGRDPLDVLGLGWEFAHVPGDRPSEEFYYPCGAGDDLGARLAPHHEVSSRWVVPGDGGDPLAELAAAVEAGGLPVAAVDNFHLPFRPAYHDVHAAHLVVVYGVDRARGLVLVSDAMPPAFTGPIRTEDFLAAWGSANPADEQDAFFSSSRIDRRYLDIRVGGEPAPLTPDFVRQALRTGVARLTDGAAPDGGPWTGLPGLRRYAAALADQARAGDGEAVRSAYPFGWPMQAGAALHGELLRTLGVRWDVPELREAGRAVEAVAHTWTGLRVTGAHGWPEPRDAADDLERHGRRLVRRHEAAVEAVALAADVI